jgi:hypothetical protein
MCSPLMRRLSEAETHPGLNEQTPGDLGQCSGGNRWSECDLQLLEAAAMRVRSLGLGRVPSHRSSNRNRQLPPAARIVRPGDAAMAECRSRSVMILIVSENRAMNKSNKFSAEARERAVRMVQAHRGKYRPWHRPHTGRHRLLYTGQSQCNKLRLFTNAETGTSVTPQHSWRCPKNRASSIDLASRQRQQPSAGACMP